MARAARGRTELRRPASLSLAGAGAVASGTRRPGLGAAAAGATARTTAARAPSAWPARAAEPGAGATGAAPPTGPGRPGTGAGAVASAGTEFGFGAVRMTAQGARPSDGTPAEPECAMAVAWRQSSSPTSRRERAAHRPGRRLRRGGQGPARPCGGGATQPERGGGGPAPWRAFAPGSWPCRRAPAGSPAPTAAAATAAR
mmetsp:Transcript_2401/g.9432  ORF Transcript_2401/g.9432 Transcript_2401/m.9432 type:complete len:200 (-) Transcript_2401:1292-1891(-)